MTFQIAPLNPIRFVNLTENQAWPVKYNTRPFDLETYTQSLFDFQTDRCFFQKYELGDSTKIQLLSDFVPICKVYNLDTGLNYTVVVTDQGITFPTETFAVYELELDFLVYGEGRLRILVSYTDVTEVVYLSEPIKVQESWENTLLFEYKNDENAFSVVFDTGIVFNLRLESILDNYTPKADRIVYNDQIRNNTLLYGVAYDEFRLNIGGREGIADWLIKKVNLIFDCNQVAIDGEYYTVAEGADWEPNRGEDYPLVGWRITVNPTENRFTQRLKPGINEEGDTIQMILHSNNRTSIGGDQTYSSIFERYAVLHGIGTIKSSGADITLLVGTTPGGDEISGPGGFLIDLSSQFTLINWVFETAETVYLSGLTGANVDINLYYYLPYDETTGGSGPAPTPATFVKGTVYMYEEVSPGDFALDWDETTGLGMAGTSYEGCALMDGRNGCGDMRGRGGMMYGDYTDVGGVYTYTRGSNVGISKHALTADEGPSHTHGLPDGGPFAEWLNNQAEAGSGSSGFEVQAHSHTQTGTAGLNAPHENRSPSYVLVYFKRITD